MPIGVQIALTIALGVVAGALSAMMGVGGAVVSTPGIRALGATPLEGIGSTLPSVLPAAITGSVRYHRERMVRWPVVAKVAPWGAIAAVGGAIASVHFPGQGHIQMIITAGLVLYTATTMVRPPTAAQRALEAHTDTPLATWWRGGIIGIGAGALSGFLGIGGGILMTPAFRRWLRLPLKDTVATSLACVGLIAIPSTITHIFEGTVNWVYALPLCIGVVPGASLGARFAIAATDRHLRVVIAWSFTVIGLAYGTAEIILLVR
jgi:uncharacterized membrane protein YfcA